MAISKLIEKPDGARNVVAYDVRVMRDYKPVYVWIPGKGIEVDYYEPENVSIQISVDFLDDESAREFEHKVRGLLPEVER